MSTPIPQLTWESMTVAVNETKRPNQFLMHLLFGAHEAKSTELIEIDVLTKGREAAPFVQKNGEAILVAGVGETFQGVEPPNIRIKRPMEASELLFQRRAGTPVFIDPAGQAAAVDRHVARQTKALADYCTNAEEYLAALSIRGQIAYQVADVANFQITWPRPAGNSVVLTTFWDDPDPTLPEPEEDFHTAKAIVSDFGVNPTDVILGTEAATAFRKIVKAQNGFGLTRPGLVTGDISFANQFTADGAIYLGMFAGIRVWEYPRTVLVNGVSTALVRSKYAEFLCVDPAAENVCYYGAIADIDAWQGGAFASERFSKSWIQKDPSAYMSLVASRPLPTLRRPGTTVSMKVVSG